MKYLSEVVSTEMNEAVWGSKRKAGATHVAIEFQTLSMIQWLGIDRLGKAHRQISTTIERVMQEDQVQEEGTKSRQERDHEFIMK